jgi:transcriptional regulator with XRE-family HTH domain
MLLASQSRMARSALGWSIRDLAEKAGVGVTTITRFEGGLTEPNRATLAAMQAALEAGGVQFIAENGGGAGVRLARGTQTQPAPGPAPLVRD